MRRLEGEKWISFHTQWVDCWFFVFCLFFVMYAFWPAVVFANGIILVTNVKQWVGIWPIRYLQNMSTNGYALPAHFKVHDIAFAFFFFLS